MGVPCLNDAFLGQGFVRPQSAILVFTVCLQKNQTFWPRQTFVVPRKCGTQQPLVYHKFPIWKKCIVSIVSPMFQQTGLDVFKNVQISFFAVHATWLSKPLVAEKLKFLHV